MLISTELAEKLDNIIAHRNGSILITGGTFFSRLNFLPLTGLSINKSIKPETKSKISTHRKLIGFFEGKSRIRHKSWAPWRKQRDKKYLFKWRLVKEDGNFGPKVYEQIIDLSN
nr:hypothetical protein [Mycoplasmopsis bovis]